MASTSTYGSWVKVTAPGANVLGPGPGGSIGGRSGTSVVAAHASAIAGLVLSVVPNANKADVASAIVDSATRVSWGGRAVTGGRVDAAGAVALALARLSIGSLPMACPTCSSRHRTPPRMTSARRPGSSEGGRPTCRLTHVFSRASAGACNTG
ncbi:MAG: hypothetical protein FJ033_05010 [Chloroflexi bacterium]|nr:hypothetical protein [Chloroflexota bacterium]